MGTEARFDFGGGFFLLMLKFFFPGFIILGFLVVGDRRWFSIRVALARVRG
jgi:hypothetical protein